MHFPLDPPWSTMLAGVSNIATLCLGYYIARWRTRRRWKAVVHHAEHAWEGWDDTDIDQELQAYRALDPKKMFDDDGKTRPETYRTMKETFVDIGGYLVILHPGDAFRVDRIVSSKGKPTGKPSSVFADMNAAVQADIARDPEGFHLAMCGQELPADEHILVIRTRCLTCKTPVAVKVVPIQDVTALELVQPQGWRLIFENRRPRAAFSLQCPACRKDILHQSEPNG